MEDEMLTTYCSSSETFAVNRLGGGGIVMVEHKQVLCPQLWPLLSDTNSQFLECFDIENSVYIVPIWRPFYRNHALNVEK